MRKVEATSALQEAHPVRVGLLHQVHACSPSAFRLAGKRRMHSCALHASDASIVPTTVDRQVAAVGQKDNGWLTEVADRQGRIMIGSPVPQVITASSDRETKAAHLPDAGRAAISMSCHSGQTADDPGRRGSIPFLSAVTRNRGMHDAGAAIVHHAMKRASGRQHRRRLGEELATRHLDRGRNLPGHPPSTERTAGNA